MPDTYHAKCSILFRITKSHQLIQPDQRSRKLNTPFNKLNKHPNGSNGHYNRLDNLDAPCARYLLAGFKIHFYGHWIGSFSGTSCTARS